MKKQKLCALLCAAMMLASSFPAFAAKTTLEEPPVEPPVQSESDLFTEKLLTATIRVIDQKGNPVPGLFLILTSCFFQQQMDMENHK